MTIYTVGYLGKMQYESIEGMNSAPMRISQRNGAHEGRSIILGRNPRNCKQLIAQMIFMFEYNVRQGPLLG